MSTSSAHASAFYREVLTNGRVWGIRDEAGFPAPKTDSGRSMPFWSSESRAKAIVANVEAYQQFRVVPLDLDEWRARWLPGLGRDGMLVGLNWSGDRVTGYDLAPMDVEQNLSACEGC
jgi:hypothetical protein